MNDTSFHTSTDSYCACAAQHSTWLVVTLFTSNRLQLSSLGVKLSSFFIGCVNFGYPVHSPVLQAVSCELQNTKGASLFQIRIRKY
jgi:hypothetical protein